MVSLKKRIKSLRSRMRRMAKAGAKFLSMKLLYPAYYRFHALKKVDEGRVVFIEVRMRSVSDNYALIYDALKCGYTFDLHVHFLEELLVPMGTTFRRSMRAIKDIAQAKYVFVNDATNMINAVKVRPETRVVQVWHACGPFKMFGYSVADLKFGATRRQMELYPIHRNYTHLILGGTESVGPYAQAMGMEDKPENIYPIGVSRTDVFYDSAFIEAAREKLYRLMPAARGKKVMLYAPTFRGRVASATTPNILRPEMLMEALGEEYCLVYNHHPFVKKRPKVPAVCREFARDMTGLMSIEELLCVTDICITDYSSLVFEYSLFRKPMIFFAYDLADYYDWRGFYYKYEDFVCGPIVTTNLELIDCVKNIADYDLTKVEAFRQRFMTACDGQATEHILGTVFGGAALTAAKRDVPLSGAFHTVPRAPRRKDEGISARLRAYFFGTYLPRVYRRAAKGNAENTAVFLQYRGNEELPEITPLRRELAKLMPELRFRSILLNRDSGGGFAYLRRTKAAVQEIARAGILITCEEIPAVAPLALRRETQHLHLPEYDYPLFTFGRGTLEYIGGYGQPFQKAPFENVTLAPAPCGALAPLFSRAYGQPALPMGSPSIDLLRDAAYRKESRRQLYELFPEAAGKKILVYAPAARPGKGGGKAPARPDVQLMLEYLAREWVVVAHFAPRVTGKGKLPLYYSGFYQDMTGKMPLLALLAAADMAVTDFRPEVFLFGATGRPILPFAADYERQIPQMELRSGWDALFAAPFTGDTMELIAKIREYAGRQTPADAFFDVQDATRQIALALRERAHNAEAET